KGEPVGKHVGQRHVGGVVGAVVRQGEGEGDDVADVGPRVTHRLRDGQVGALRRLGGGVAVVGGVGVELVGGNDARRVRQRVGAVHPHLELQRQRRRGTDRADVPDAGGAVVRPLRGGGGDETEPGGQQVADADVGGVVGAVVAQGDGVGDDV